jgi:hypothetical protein
MFSVHWVTHFSKTPLIETEYRFNFYLDDLVTLCLTRLPAIRVKPFDMAADGFLIFNDHHKEVWRCFSASPRLEMRL